MGAPLFGGGSTWFHHADSFDLLDADGTLWARVAVPVARDRFTLTFPLLDDPWSTFHALEVFLDGDHAVVRQFTDGAQRDVTWTGATPATQLVTTACIHPRGKFDVRRAEVHATLVAEGGALTVRDAGGTTRIHLQLGDEDPTWTGGERGVLRRGEQPAVAFWFPPPSRVRRAATSLP